MNVTQKTKITKVRKKLQHIDLQGLIDKSDYIQSKCINEIRAHEIWGEHWWHALPVKDQKEYLLSPENWNLPREEVIKILKYESELKDYACLIVYSGVDQNIRDCFDDVTHFLPPWKVFPLYNETMLGWRMGCGESYQDLWCAFVNECLTDEEFELYQKTYPVPCYFSIRFYWYQRK